LARERVTKCLDNTRTILDELTNLNADVHISLLKEKWSHVEDDIDINEDERISNSFNCTDFVLEENMNEIRPLERETYRLPDADSEIGMVMRNVLTRMREKRDPSNMVTMKELRTQTVPNDRDSSCIKVAHEREAEYLHELIARLVSAMYIYPLNELLTSYLRIQT
jgi:predicted nuclease with TOPRIM domain